MIAICESNSITMSCQIISNHNKAKWVWSVSVSIRVSILGIVGRAGGSAWVKQRLIWVDPVAGGTLVVTSWSRTLTGTLPWCKVSNFAEWCWTTHPCTQASGSGSWYRRHSWMLARRERWCKHWDVLDLERTTPSENRCQMVNDYHCSGHWNCL